MSIVLRPYDPSRPGEANFVIKSWRESYADSDAAKRYAFHGRCPSFADRFKWHAPDEYYRTWDALIATLVSQCTVRMAENDETGLLAGFVCWELTGPWGVVVHYVYTRLSARGQGVAKQLIGELPGGRVMYTHRGAGVTRVPDGWVFSEAPLYGVGGRLAA